MRTFFLSMTALILGGFLSTAMATKFAEPDDQVIKSPNGKYALKINADTGEHRLCEVVADKPGQEKVLWSFKREVWHDQYFVSNDGKHVLWVAWDYVKVEDAAKESAIVVYSAQGEALKKTYAEIANARPYMNGEIGTVGDFWRIWLEDAAVQKDDVVTIKPAGKGDFVVDLSDLSKTTKEG